MTVRLSAHCAGAQPARREPGARPRSPRCKSARGRGWKLQAHASAASLLAGVDGPFRAVQLRNYRDDRKAQAAALAARFLAAIKALGNTRTLALGYASSGIEHFQKHDIVL